MPYKDPDKERESAAQRKRNQRERQKLRDLSGGGAAAQGHLQLVTEAPRARKKAPMTMADWAREKCEIGETLLELAQEALKSAKKNETHVVPARDAVVMLGRGIDLLNANLPILQPMEGPKRGNVEQEDANWLADPEYRQVMTQALKIRQRLQAEQQAKAG